jgi:transposase
MSEPAVAPSEVLLPPRPRAGARQLWVERLARFATSGLRPAEFCAAEGVSLPSFYSWRRRLDADGRPPAAEQNGDTQPGPRLLPVRLPTAAAAVELVLPGGAVLRVPPGSDLAFVRSLVEALGDGSC